MNTKDSYKIAFKFAMVANVLLVITAAVLLSMYMKAEKVLESSGLSSKNSLTETESDEARVKILTEEDYAGSTSPTTGSTTSAQTDETTEGAGDVIITTGTENGGTTARKTTSTTTATTTAETGTTKTTARTSPVPTRYDDNDGDWIAGWD